MTCRRIFPVWKLWHSTRYSLPHFAISQDSEFLLNCQRCQTTQGQKQFPTNCSQLLCLLLFLWKRLVCYRRFQDVNWTFLTLQATGMRLLIAWAVGQVLVTPLAVSTWQIASNFCFLNFGAFVRRLVCFHLQPPFPGRFRRDLDCWIISLFKKGVYVGDIIQSNTLLRALLLPLLWKIHGWLTNKRSSNPKKWKTMNWTRKGWDVNTTYLLIRSFCFFTCMYKFVWIYTRTLALIKIDVQLYLDVTVGI